MSASRRPANKAPNRITTINCSGTSAAATAIKRSTMSRWIPLRLERLAVLRVIRQEPGRRGARTTRLTVERLTPVLRATCSCIAWGLAASAAATLAHCSGTSCL
jgi:hypothetical protein